LPIKKKLFDLAIKYGVMLILAMKFFSEKVSKEKNVENYVRCSISNLNLEQTRKSTRLILEYLRS